MTLTTYDTFEQGSDEWLAARCGIPTASVIGGLISTGIIGAAGYACPDCGAAVDEPCLSKSTATPKPIKSFHDARADVAVEVSAVTYEPATGETARAIAVSLAAERITGHVDPVYVNADMQRGHDEEPLSRDLYAASRGVTVDQVAFMVEDKWGYQIGFSPDGLIGDDGLFETKSRRQKKQVLTVVSGEVPPENYMQLQCGLLVSGRKWIDFASYSNGMPFWTKRVYPNPVAFKAILRAVEKLEADIAEIVAKYEAAVEGLPCAPRLAEFDEIVI